MMKHSIRRVSGLSLALLMIGVGGSALAQPTLPHSGSSEGSLTIALHHGETSNHQQVMYQCRAESKNDDHGAKDLLKSLPEGGRFSVSYLNADMTALAVLPVDGNVLVMANVIAGSGAKYVADRYEWFTQGDEATFSRADREGALVSCRVLPEAEAHPKADKAQQEMSHSVTAEHTAPSMSQKQAPKASSSSP